jgi:site-specific DNA recombinase
MKHLIMNDFQDAIVWSYSRVSSKEQFEKNSSIETQVKGIKEFAEANRLVIVREFDAAYESSKSLSHQKTLNELIETLKRTPKSDLPKLILLWSPSRFGRSGVEHISLLSSLRTIYGVRLYAVSNGKNTFDVRSEHEFAKELLIAQQENFNRQDVIIPGMRNFVSKGFRLGTAPRGYDQYGPRCTDPARVQGRQEIKVNDEGRWLKKAFQMKIYDDAKDSHIIAFMASKGYRIPKQTLSKMWLNPFYAGINRSRLLNGKDIKGNWEPLITKPEWEILQSKLKGSFMRGISKLPGKEQTPLIPRFLKCTVCGHNMTSYEHKKTGNYYYKCNPCNHTVNANSSSRTIREGMHEKFGELLSRYKMNSVLLPVLQEQIELALETSFQRFEDQRTDLRMQISTKRGQIEHMEHRYVIGDLNEALWLKHSALVANEIHALEEMLEKLPSKKSNLKILDERILEMLEDPRQFWQSLNTMQKRRIQEVLFPSGLLYDPKTREYLTSNAHILLELTGCFIETWGTVKNKTQRQNAFGSRLVARGRIELPTSGL